MEEIISTFGEVVLSGIHAGHPWEVSLEVDNGEFYTWMTLDGKDTFGFGGDLFDPSGLINVWHGVRNSGDKIILLRAAEECVSVIFKEGGLSVAKKNLLTSYGVNVNAYFASPGARVTNLVLIDRLGAELHEMLVAWD